MSSAVNAASAVRLEIPEFWCPFPASEHPRTGQFGNRALEWLEQFGFSPDTTEKVRLAGFDIGRLIGCTAPRALDEQAEVATWLNLLYHILDDWVGDAGRERRTLPGLVTLALRLNHAMLAPFEAYVADEPFAAALADISRRVVLFATGTQYGWWLAGIQSYLLHELGEAIWREQQEVPGLRDYAVYCVDGRAALPSMLMLPILGGYEVEDAAMRRIRRLVRLACLIACLDNDIYSLPKEATQRGHVSLPLLIAHQTGAGLQEALEQARAVRDQVMLAFVAEYRQVIESVTPGGRYLAKDLATWIRGQLEWGLSSERFVHPNGALPRNKWAVGPCSAGAWAVAAADSLLEVVG
jgi:hypothetical protein